MNSKEYWARREAEALRHYITEEAAYDKEIKRIYQNMLDACQKEIESFYAKYAAAEGISIAAAKRRVSKLDIAAYERKAAKYVKERNFSKKANEEMRLYNATMKINRLEMLKANIGLETVAGHDELEKFMGGILKGRTEDELKRQAGILGKTVLNNSKKADAIVNGSFHSGTFSDRIWQYQDLMREDLGKLLQQGLIQGKGARALTKDLRKYLVGDKQGKGATYNVERLMRTELARVQTEAQKQSFIRNGFDMYEFICNHHASKHNTCPICLGLDGKHFKVEDMMPGENAPPMHPNCRCSTAAWEDDAEYEAWLDHLDNGGTTKQWNATGKAEWIKHNSQISKQALENSKKSATMKAEASTISAKAKKLPDAKERSRVINEAISAKTPVYAEDLRKVFKSVKPKDGCLDICLHGAQFFTEYEGKYILDTETLYYIISGRREYQKQNIRLLSCSTGKEDKYGNCVAQELANRLGVDVYAPIAVLNIYEDGKLTVGREELPEEKGFKWFTPKEGGRNK